MDESKLKKLLAELQQDVQQLEQLPTTQKEHLHEILTEIHEAVEAPDPTPITIGDRLDAFVADWEESHPTLMDGLERLVSALSNMGI